MWKAGCGEGLPTPVIPPTPWSASCPGPHVWRLFSGSARRAGGLAACLRKLQVASWISLTRTWTSRMSLTTLCGRCSTTICSAGHSTSWWLDHRHQHSRLFYRRGVQHCAFMREGISCSAAASLLRKRSSTISVRSQSCSMVRGGQEPLRGSICMLCPLPVTP